MVTKNKLQKLRDQLPRGFAKTIRSRLLLSGFDFSEGYIERVLNPYDRRMSLIIIEEAIKVRDELRNEIAELEKRI